MTYLHRLPVHVIEQIVSHLKDDEHSETRLLHSCGVVVLSLLRDAADQLLEPRPSATMTRHRIALRSLFSLAEETINATSFNQVERKWLQLYTDATVLISLYDLVMNGVERLDLWMATVKMLDKAIIVAGAVGCGRMEWVQATIQAAQGVGLPRIQLEEASHKRRRLEESSDLLWASSPVPEIPPPSLSRYTSTLYDRPFILRQYFQSKDSPSPAWPAISRWKSMDYLMDQVGEGRVVPVEVGRAYDEPGWGQEIIPFRQFMQRASGKERGKPLYLAQHPLFRQFPALEKDMMYPDYVWSAPPAPSDVDSYTPPTTEDGVLVNVWVGGGNVISPAHTDPYFNCYAQVVGRKRIWLAPPRSGPHMYAYSGEGEDGDLAEKYMSNTSRVPIFRKNREQVKQEYPRFFHHVWPNSLEGVLHPGDLLVLPPGWWHAMKGEGEGFGWSVSMWY